MSDTNETDTNATAPKKGDDRIIVGAIAGSFGVFGEVRIKSFCADPEAIGDYSPLTSEDGKTTYALTLTRSIKNGFAAELDGVTTKEEADALKGVTLYARRDVLPSLPDDEYYHADLVGLSVLDTGGHRAWYRDERPQPRGG